MKSKEFCLGYCMARMGRYYLTPYIMLEPGGVVRAAHSRIGNSQNRKLDLCRKGVEEPLKTTYLTPLKGHIKYTTVVTHQNNRTCSIR